MSEVEQLGAFHAALIAFEIRFEQELTDHWERLLYASYSAITDAPITERHRPFCRFFTDASAEVARLIHEYFPTHLQISIANRSHLGDRSPMIWSQSQILIQVCNFLGMDECFDEALDPRTDSRVLASAEWLTTEGRGPAMAPPLALSCFPGGPKFHIR
jgi:hypothetical protein